MVHHNAILLKQSVIRYRPRRQDSDAIIRTLLNLMENILIDGF